MVRRDEDSSVFDVPIHRRGGGDTDGNSGNEIIGAVRVKPRAGVERLRLSWIEGV